MRIHWVSHVFAFYERQVGMRSVCGGDGGGEGTGKALEGELGGAVMESEEVEDDELCYD